MTRLAALASAPVCAASPDHADIMETIENAADDWQKRGYPTALAEVRDMANVGRSLLERIADHSSEGPLKGWHPADCPTEVVCDLLNMLADASAPAGDGVDAATRMMRDCADDLVSTASHHGQYAAIDQDKIDGLRDAVRDYDAALARPRAAVPTLADMAAFGASDAACTLYPGADQQAERAAFCEGAAHAVSSPREAVGEREA